MQEIRKTTKNAEILSPTVALGTLHLLNKVHESSAFEEFVGSHMEVPTRVSPRQATLYLPKDPSHNSACASFSAIRDASQSKNLRLLLSRKLPTRLSALARNIYFTIFPEHLSLKKNPSEQDTVSCEKKPVQNIFFVFCN